MRLSTFLRAVLLTLGLLAGLPATAQSILFTTSSPGAVDGPGGPGSTQFGDGDIVEFDPAAGMGTILYLADDINDDGLSDMNALYRTSNGNIIFSLQSGFAGFAFQDDQLIEYNPITDTLSLFYDFAGLITTNGDVDVDGFHILPSGNFLIANTSDFVLDGQSFENGDIVEFDPITQTASLYFSEDLFDGDDDIWVRGVSMLDNGNLVLSAFNFDNPLMTLGGLTFGRGDLVEYDINNDIASLFVDSSIFGGATEEFDGVHVIPVPAAVWLFVSALGLLVRLRARS